MAKIRLSAAALSRLLTDAHQRGYHAGYAKCEADWREGLDEIRAEFSVQPRDGRDALASDINNEVADEEDEERCADDEDAHQESVPDDEPPEDDGRWWVEDGWLLSPHNVSDFRAKLEQHPYPNIREALLAVVDVIKSGGGKLVTVSHRGGFQQYAFQWEMPERDGGFSVGPITFSAQGTLPFCLHRARYLIDAYHAPPMPPLANYTYVKKDGVQYRFSHSPSGAILNKEREIAPYVFERVAR